MAQPTVSGDTPGHVVLRDIRKQTEQVMEVEPVSRAPPWSLLQFPTPGFCSESLS